MVNKHTIRAASGRKAFSRDVNAMLGLDKGTKLPSRGMIPRLIQGVTVWVKPAAPAQLQGGRNPRMVKSSKHRVMCYCPVCRVELSVGRLHQHVCEYWGHGTQGGELYTVRWAVRPKSWAEEEAKHVLSFMDPTNDVCVWAADSYSKASLRAAAARAGYYKLGSAARAEALRTQTVGV